MKIDNFNDKTWEVLGVLKRLISTEGLIIDWKRRLNKHEEFHKDKSEFASVMEIKKLGGLETRAEEIEPKDLVRYYSPLEYFGEILYLDILQPKFDEIYGEYQKKYSANKNDVNQEGIIVIDLQKGIYNKNNSKSVYEIAGKRKLIVKYLLENKIASLADLVATTGQGDQLISAGIKKINSNFKKKCHIKKDLIIHSKTAGGYRLSTDDLKIVKIST